MFRELIFGYWAHNPATGEKINFLSSTFVDIGGKYIHNDIEYIIDDWVVDESISVYEDVEERMVS